MPSAPFRAVILRFSNDAAHAAVERVMQRVPFTYAASIGAVPRTYTALGPDAQRWFPSSDVRGGLYADTDFTKLLPLDADLVGRMREHEAVFMHILCRLEQWRFIPFDERRRIYYRHLRFWNDFLERNAINLLLAGILPHEIPDYVIYGLCKAKGIPTWMFHATTVRDTATLFSDIEDQAPQTRERYAELERRHAMDAPESVQLGPLFEEYFRAQTRPEGKTAIAFRRPTLIDRLLTGARKHGMGSVATIARWIPLLASVSAWRGRYRKVRAWYRIRRLRRFYDQHAVAPDYDRPYIYVPLHFQPECSTCPMAGAFVDQQVSITLLSQEAPADVLLYVKEHPVQRRKAFACRSIRFYRELLALPNVRLIEHSADTFALREHCRAVATATGTAGFEAIFRGKPVFMFGHRFYQDAPGVFTIHTVEDCRAAMRAIFTGNARPDPTRVRLFLRALEETGVHASVTDWHQRQASDLTFEQHVEAIAGALAARIGSS